MEKLFTSLIFCLFIYLNPEAQNPYFPPTNSDSWESLSLEELGWCEDKLEELIDFLEQRNTQAFIVLKDGKIVIEQYFDTTSVDTWRPWNSAGKTLTTFLVGIAQEEGLLNTEDQTSDYLGEGWTSLTPDQEAQITIWHQLTMTTGLDDSDPYCTDPECLHYLADAGTRWSYHNAPYTLLRSVTENASGIDYNIYTYQKIKSLIGMNGLWIPLGYNNVYFSNARSMARFGWLVANNGVWDGATVLGDTSFIQNAISPSQELNQGYGYLWWLNGQDTYMLPGSQLQFSGFITPSAPATMYSAVGKDGQFLDIVPEENIIVVRMGGAPDDLPVPLAFHDEMWEKLSEIICNPTNTNELIYNEQINISPNPFTDQLHIKTEKEISSLTLYNNTGQLLQSVKQSSDFHLNDLPSGVYYLQIFFEDMGFSFHRLVR